MAHIIEVIRNSEAEARSFLDALFYSDSVSAIGFRVDGERARAVAVNWDEDASSELDERISEMISAALQADDDIDEIASYCRIFPETVPYNRVAANETTPTRSN
jgi:hypothetical protein